MIVDPDYLDHWKVKMLERLLGCPRAMAIPLRLWGHCQLRRSDTIGDLPAEGLAAICKWEGDPLRLKSALIECRFIREKGDKIVVHGWRERNRKYLANARNGKKGGRPRKTQAVDCKKVARKPNENPWVSVGLTQTEPNANPTETVEKRREEKRILPPTVPRNGGQEGESSGGASISDPEFFLSRLCPIFGRKNKRLGYEAQYELARVLPVPEEDLRMVEWLYRRPPGEEHALRVRRNDLDAVIRNWDVEVDRARRYWAESGNEVLGSGVRPEADPPGWREWYAESYPDGKRVERWMDLPESVRGEYTPRPADAGHPSREGI